MAYGLRVINDDSELLVDSDYVNPTFIQKLEFNTTPTFTEAGVRGPATGGDLMSGRHPDYYRYTYSTPVAQLNTGSYIVLWKIPDNGSSDIWYNFSTSVMDFNNTLTCDVFVNQTGSSLSFTLPTAYIFATNSGALSTLSSTGPALRLYDTSGNKTFDSNFVQLVPNNFSQSYSAPYPGDPAVSLTLSGPTNPIYLLPKNYSIYTKNATGADSNLADQIRYDAVYKRQGSTIYTKQLSTYWKRITYSVSGIVQYYGGSTSNLNVMVADADFYQSSGASTIPGSAIPTYSLSANYGTVNETTNNTIVVTLTTTLLANNTQIYYTVTGINATDLSSGSINGAFIIQNNTATATFVVAADSSTEGPETFLLTLNGINSSISVSITDSSRTPYSWSAPSLSSVNEGSSITIDFNGLYNDSTNPITFSLAGPSTGAAWDQIYAYPDITYTYAIPSGALYTRVTITARADLQLEGTEAFRMVATVGGNNYYSSDITINDTTTSSVTAANNWVVGTDNTVTISVVGGLGKTLSLYSIDSTVIDVKSGSASSWLIDSNNFTTTTTYQAKALNPGTFPNVGLWLKNGEEFISVKYITTSAPAANYSWGTVSSTNEGSTGSVQFNYNNAAGVSIGFDIVSPTGSVVDGSTTADVTLTTTTYTTPNSYTAGSVSVSYSVAQDYVTEGFEYFRLRALVNGVYYYSDNITINDTSLTPAYGITAVSPPWNENTTKSTTVSLTNVLGYTYFPTSDNANVTCQTASFYVDSNNFTTTLYWNVGAVTADTTVTLQLRRSRSNGIIDASTTVVVKDIPTAGTPIGSAYCLAYGTSPYTLRQVYADGSGGTYNTDTNNSATCGYIAPTYTLSATPTTVNEGSSFTITLTTNQSGSFAYTITGVSSADIGSTSLTGTLANNGTRTINVSADAITEGTEYFTVSLDNGLASTVVTINDTSKESLSIERSGSTTGTVGSSFTTYFVMKANGTQYPADWSYTGTLPPGTTFSKSGNTFGNYYQIYTLSGTPTTAGTYSPIITGVLSNGNSTSFQAFTTIYAQAGTTSGSQYCSGTTLYQNYNDGSGGVYAQVVQTNSTSCGYIAPSYSLYQTFTSLANGSSGSFAVFSNNANGIILTPTLSGASAGRLTISPTSTAIAGSSNVYTYFTITASTPTTSYSAETVTVNVAGLSFSFTLQAFTISTIPLVTSVTYPNGQYYYNGDVITAVINFNGPITASTYVRVQVNAGVYGTGNNVFVAGTSYSNASFPIGASSGYYISNANPGIYNTSARISARTEDVNGTLQQAYVDGTLATLYKAGVIPP